MPPRPRLPGQPEQAAVPGQQQADRPPQLPATRFALAPALASGDIIDFSTPAGAKIFKAGTEPLSSTFDCTPVNLQLFLDQLKDKVAIFDWTDVIDITTTEQLISKSLLEHYGEVTYEMVKEHATTYVNSSTRKAQDSFMLYNCIMSSLTDEAQKQVRNRGLVTPFHIEHRGSGALLLKVVIMVSHVDTRATVTAVRTKLSSLDIAMKEHDSDVEIFNNYVLSLVSQLHARGEQTQDLLVNLLKGYKACKDLDFVDYIRKKEDVYEEGGLVEYNQLMDWAVNKFKARKEAGTWCKKTTEEETIIALQAQVQELVRKKDDRKRSNFRELDPWMKVPPTEGDRKSKMVNNRLFHWCQFHKQWTRHKSADCRLGKQKVPENKEASLKKQEKKKQSKLATALEAIDDEPSEDEEE